MSNGDKVNIKIVLLDGIYKTLQLTTFVFEIII
jgi:hypothetical protein